MHFLKDIPNLEGDRQYNITNFTIQLGQQAVFNLACWLFSELFGHGTCGRTLSALNHQSSGGPGVSK